MLNNETLKQIESDVELGFPTKDEYRWYCRRLIGEVVRLQMELREWQRIAREGRNEQR